MTDPGGVAAPQPKSRRSKILGLVARVAIGLGLLGLAIRMNRAELQGVIDRRPDPLGFGRGLAFYLSGLTLAYVRWYMLVRASGLSFRLRDAMRLGWIGAFFNFVIPGAVFGNVVKAAFLAREKPEDRPRAIASVLVDFLCGLTGLFLLAALAGTIGRDRLPASARPLLVVVWFAASLSAIALLSAFRRRRKRREGLGSSAYRGRMAVVVAALVMGMATHFLNVLAFHTVNVALYGDRVPSLPAHLLVVPLVLFTTAVPLPFGALGVSEQASQGLFTMLNSPGGAVAMLGFRVLMLAGATIGAGAYLLNASEVRALARERGAIPVEHAGS